MVIIKFLPFFFALFCHVLAQEGNSCEYEGLRGTCMDIGNCTSGYLIDSGCPSDAGNVQCCIDAAPPSRITRRAAPPQSVLVTFWINAFIPLNVPGVTHVYPKDQSKTMIRGPPLTHCFLTDQRSWSSKFGAGARMRSVASVLIASTYHKVEQLHECGETIQVACGDGDVLKRRTADTSDMKFTKTHGTTSKVVLDYSAAASNPLVPLSPNIDLKGTLTIDRINRFVEFVGKVDDFPAFEAYVEINGDNSHTIHRLDRKDGAGPASLVGGANREFKGRYNF